MAIIAKYTGQSAARISTAIAYSDAEARLDMQDVLHQIAQFKAQNMLKGPVTGEEIVDRRYATVLPQP